MRSDLNVRARPLRRRTTVLPGNHHLPPLPPAGRVALVQTLLRRDLVADGGARTVLRP